MSIGCNCSSSARVPELVFCTVTIDDEVSSKFDDSLASMVGEESFAIDEGPEFGGGYCKIYIILLERRSTFHFRVL